MRGQLDGSYFAELTISVSWNAKMDYSQPTSSFQMKKEERLDASISHVQWNRLGKP